MPALALVPQKLTARNWEDLRVCVKTHTQRQGTDSHYRLSLGSHRAQIWPRSRMSTRLQGPDKGRAPQVNCMKIQGGRDLTNTCPSTPTLQGCPEGQTLKKNLCSQDPSHRPRPVGPAQRCVGRKHRVYPHFRDRNK